MSHSNQIKVQSRQGIYAPNITKRAADAISVARVTRNLGYRCGASMAERVGVSPSLARLAMQLEAVKYCGMSDDDEFVYFEEV